MSTSLEKVKKLRPIDDIFFQKLIEDIGVCEEILRVILADENLQVLSVTPQCDQKNLWGRSVRLDALCRLGNGALCNIEVQNSSNDNHVTKQCQKDWERMYIITTCMWCMYRLLRSMFYGAKDARTSLLSGL